MTVPEILKELEIFTRRFPKAAVAAAIEQREAITPELLRVLEAVAEDPAEHAKRTEFMTPIFALYLLAQFRETRAYRPIVKICGAPERTLDGLVGETLTSGMSRILASVYDGDPAPLHGLIENAQAYEFARSTAIEALAVLASTGQMERSAVIEYLRGLFAGKLEREHSFAWDGLICTVADMPAPELLEEVRWAYAEGLVDPGVADLKGVERDLASGKPQPNRAGLIVDTIAEMEWWAAFNPEPAAKRTKDFKDSDLEQIRASFKAEQPPVERCEPARREAPKIGRNDPCPCGSGKKHKKCCLAS